MRPVVDPVACIRSGAGSPGVEDIEPERRAGSKACCLERYSSSDMISSASVSLPSTDAGVDFDMGGVYGRGVWRAGGMYGAVGRCKLEDVENCEVFEVERVCRWRPFFTEAKLTSTTEGV